MGTKDDDAIIVRVRLTVSSHARRYIAGQYPEAPTGREGITARKHLAQRKLVERYIQERITALSALWPHWDDTPLTELERVEAAYAVDLLRSQGKSDIEIRNWLSLQRARIKAVMLKKTDRNAKRESRRHVR